MTDLKNELKIIITGDQSATILNKKIDETYHSVNGALQESNHIFIENGIKHIIKKNVSVLEIGLGTGLNAALTMTYAAQNKLKVYYNALEPFPLDNDIITEYCKFFNNEISEKIKQISNAEWNVDIEIFKNFILKKENIELQKYSTTKRFSIIYFDAFSPSKQPELWTYEIFSKMYEILEEQGVLITYSAKGEVRRNLKKAGFRVKSLLGPPGKREITLAMKC